jgi:uroporphyrinogen decarboxylase
MSPITNCIKNKDTKINPIWLMRQAGRYLPEFREIRKENQNFIKLCLNSDVASEITLQPIKRFGFDGAVIFSDILMLPYGIGQKVEFEKNFGPKLGDIELEKINKIDEIKFTENLSKVYEAISKTSKDPIMTNRDMIGFVGAPWTILVYMINKSSPKKGLSSEFYKDDLFII